MAGMTLAALVGCGGGGSDDANSTTTGLSQNQKNFESFALNDKYAVFIWNLPGINTTPTSGTHYFYYEVNGATGSPSLAPQSNAISAVNLTSSLALADLTKIFVNRVLVNKNIYYRNETHQQTWSYSGENIVLTSLGSDGVTPLYSNTYDNWSAPIPLNGAIFDSTVMRSYLNFLKRTNDTENFDFTKSWLPGSTYITRKSYATEDIVFVWDSSGTTYDNNPSPLNTTATSLVDLFNAPIFTNTGGYNADGVIYKYSDGDIVNHGGVDVWVAKTARPVSADPTGAYAVLFSLNGKIYRGAMQKKGVRFKYLDQVDTTQVLDTSMRFNIKAAESIKNAVKF